MFSKFSSKSVFQANPNALDYRWVFALSCLLSIWLIAIDPIINRDGIIYLRAADAYLQGGILAGQSIFDRPLLPIAFATIHQLTGIPLLYCGLILTTLFFALMTSGFVATVKVLGGDRRVQIIAAVVILSHPMLNHSRSSIMRDPAYWAFSILAFRELLLYVRSPGFKHQLRWFALIATATLFRFEGLFFVALAPIAIVIASDKGSRWRSCLRLFPLPLLAFASLVAILASVQNGLSLQDGLFPDIGRYIRHFLDISQTYAELGRITAENWLEFTAKEDAMFAISGGLLAILGVNMFRAFTWPYALLLLWGISKKLQDRIAKKDRTLINTHLVIGGLYLVLFLLTKRFMLERYCGIFTLYLLLYIPFLLNSLWTMGAKKQGRYLVLLILIGFSIDSLTNRDYEKAYISDATAWLRENSPSDASLVTNSSFIAYFSQRQFEWGSRAYQFKIADLSAELQHWRETDYLVMLVKKREIEQWQDFLENQGLLQLQVFEGHRTGLVSIVKIPETPRQSPAPCSRSEDIECGDTLPQPNELSPDSKGD